MSASADTSGGRQSRAKSLIEAITNVVVGYGLAVATQVAVFPLFGLGVTLSQNLMISCLFTVISVGRSYALRRAFEAIRIRATTKTAAGR